MQLISTGLLFITAMNSLELVAQIQTSSIDYWIGNISPRCAVNIIYYNFTNDFIFNSTHNTPVMLVPLKYYNNFNRWPRQIYLMKTKYFNSSHRFPRAECYFSIIYYELSNHLKNTTSDDDPYILQDWLRYIAYGFPIRLSDSNVTHWSLDKFNEPD